ncbi:glucokinase [Bacteroides clarus YIT 12056]|uniref:ROK family protein n=1 Tax=Bacteroides clarus YIT 12056 TaxID=762984 RepID=A0ABN0CN29_9BACE|nr:ROK family protein [Bacteroides clarus]EGF51389.1 ROK family protein [Bacteroides clarus YIT 12056]SHG93201.1 glucokinase [Bacteroides clarus YIT 12056]
MHYIGIDLGGTIIKVGLVEDGKVVDVKKLDAGSKYGLMPRLDFIANAIDNLLLENNISSNELGGVFLAFPGIVNVRSKRIVSTNAKYDDAPSIDLQCWCCEHWNVPFAIDNDARAATVGEWQFGVAYGKKNVVMMTIGTGIGTGVILEGKLLYGQHYRAGSLGGHLIVNYQGRKCSCGNVGCVEAHASSFFLPQIIQENEFLSQNFRNDIANYNFKELFAQAAAGIVDAKLVIENCMDVWSAAIVNYIHAYDPQVVILGGGIMKSKDVILPYIRRKVNALAWCPDGKVEIMASILGDDAALIAAGYYFFK